MENVPFPKGVIRGRCSIHVVAFKSPETPGRITDPRQSANVVIETAVTIGKDVKARPLLVSDKRRAGVIVLFTIHIICEGFADVTRP
jgi:hypothetical protein